MLIQRWRIALLILLTGVASPNLALANEYLLSESLSKNNTFIESTVATLVLAEFVRGDIEKAHCINNRYFGSPADTRSIINAVWKYRVHQAESVFTALFSVLCSKDRKAAPENHDLWNFTESKPIDIQEANPAIDIDAGIRALGGLAIREKNDVATKCITDKYGNKEWRNLVDSSINLVSRIEFYNDIVRVVHKECNFPTELSVLVSQSSIKFPDFIAVARERIFAVRDLERCERETSDPEKEACVSLYADLRRGDIAVKAALTANAAEMKAVGETLDAVRKAAWRLPDGRLIFEDKDGNWRFEDGSTADPELVKQRIAP